MSTQNKSNRRTAAFKSVVVSASFMIGLVLASSPVQAWTPRRAALQHPALGSMAMSAKMDAA